VAALLSVFAGLALALAAVGVYGVTWHGASWRARELAVRLALGADPARVLRGVLRSTLAMTAAGLGLGLAGSVALGRVLTRFLFGVAPLDPATLGATAALLGLVAVLAAWSPASRAGRADPMRALRPE
jgi:putative ABC transport system permease protein